MPRHNHTSRPDPEEAFNSLWSRTSCQFRVSSWKSRAEFEEKSGIRIIDRELSTYYESVYLDLPRATLKDPFPGLSCDDLIAYILGADGQRTPVISTSCSFIWALWNMTVHWARGWVGLDDAVCLELILPKAPRGRPGSVGYKAISLLRAMSDYHTTWNFSRARNYASVSEQVLYFGKIDRCRIRWRHVFGVQVSPRDQLLYGVRLNRLGISRFPACATLSRGKASNRFTAPGRFNLQRAQFIQTGHEMVTTGPLAQRAQRHETHQDPIPQRLLRSRGSF
jgi:hypothetical protein